MPEGAEGPQIATARAERRKQAFWSTERDAARILEEEKFDRETTLGKC